MFKSRIFILIAITASVTGCATQTQQPTASEVAVEQFRKQMMDIGRETVVNINNSNKIAYSSDPRSDWVSYIDESDALNSTMDLSFLNDAWTGTFSNLLGEIEVRTGYRVLNLLDDSKISNKIVTIHGDNTTALKALYTAYTRISHENIDLVIRPYEKVILLRPSCVDSFNCDGMHDLTNPKPY